MLAAQCGVPALYPYDLAFRSGVRPVNGRYTVGEALSRMLRGTPFTGAITPSGVVTISSARRREGEVHNNTKAMLLAGAGMLAVASGPGEAFAQDAAVATQATTVDEILVTAQKRTETVQSVPASISAIGGEELAERGINNVNDLQFAVPSLQSGTFLRGTGISIRGVGPGPGSPGVAVSVDGVYQTQTAMADLAQFDLQRVETLRGPQGTLYGRNANAGAVNFITSAPTDQFEGYLLAGYASYEQSRVQAVVNLPLGERVRTRWSVDYKDQNEGFIENVHPRGDDLAKGETVNGRVRVAVDLTPTLELDVGLIGLHSHGPWEYYVPAAPLSAAIQQQNPLFAGVTFPQEPWKTNENDNPTGTRDYGSARATFSWQAPFGEAKSITAYQRYTYESRGGDGLPITFSPYQTKNVDAVFTQEVNLSGATPRADWSAGAFFMDEKNSQNLVFNFPLGRPGLPPGAYLNFFQPAYETRSYGVFADASVAVAERLKVIGGARYSRDELSVEYGSRLGVIVGGQNIVLAAVCPRRTEELSFDSFTPRAGVQYEIDADKNVYATYSRGFKAGGVNIFGCQNAYNPEKITSYEAGVKTRLLDRRLTLNASAFFYDYTDFQLGQIVGVTFLITNASTAEVKGLEIEAAWAPDEHWSISGNTSFIEATYTNFQNLDSLNPLLGVQDLAGNYLNRTPKVSANLSVAYRTSETPYGRATLRADASYRSRVYFREFNRPEDSQDPYGLLNLSVVWDSPDERYSARLFVNNLTEEAYYAGLSGDSTTANRNISWGDPRQVGLELKANF